MKVPFRTHKKETIPIVNCTSENTENCNPVLTQLYITYIQLTHNYI